MWPGRACSLTSSGVVEIIFREHPLSNYETSTSSTQPVNDVQQVDHGTARLGSIGRVDVRQLESLLEDLRDLFPGPVDEHWVFRPEEGSRQSRSVSRTTQTMREVSALSWDKLRAWFVHDGKIRVVRNLEIQLSDFEHHMKLELGIRRGRGAWNSHAVRLTVSGPARGQMFVEAERLLFALSYKTGNLFLKTLFAWIVVPMGCAGLFYGPVDLAIKEGRTGEELWRMIAPPVFLGSLTTVVLLLCIFARARAKTATRIVGDWEVDTVGKRFRTYLAEFRLWWRGRSRYERVMTALALIATAAAVLALL
jgi:hypothetical protein